MARKIQEVINLTDAELESAKGQIQELIQMADRLQGDLCNLYNDTTEIPIFRLVSRTLDPIADLAIELHAKLKKWGGEETDESDPGTPF